MTAPRSAEEIVKHFPSWRYDVHGRFVCVWCHATTTVRKVTISVPKPGEAIGYYEPEDPTAHTPGCFLLTAVEVLHAYAAQECAALQAALTELPTWGTYSWREAAVSVKSKLKENAAQIVQLIHERDALKQRVEALRAYTVHKYSCATFGTAKDPMHVFPIINPGSCDCGLEAALRYRKAG